MKGTLVVNDIRMSIDAINLVDRSIKFTAKGTPEEDGTFYAGDLVKVYDNDGGYVGTWALPGVVGDATIYSAGKPIMFKLAVAFRNDGTGIPRVVQP